MAADCSYFCWSKSFTVCAPNCSMDGSRLLIPPLITGFPDGSRAILLSGRQLIAILPLEGDKPHPWSSIGGRTSQSNTGRSDSNGFHDGLCAVSLRRWQRVARSSARTRLSLPFACCIPQRMPAACPFSCSSTAFTVCTPFCSAYDSALLTLLLVNGFHCLHAVLLSGWQRIPSSYTHQRLSLFPHRFAQRMAADCSFFRTSTAFTVCMPFCSADGSRLLILPLVNGFHNGLHAVLPSGWQGVAHSSAS